MLEISLEENIDLSELIDDSEIFFTKRYSRHGEKIRKV